MSWSSEANEQMAGIQAGLGLNSGEMSTLISQMSIWAKANANGTHRLRPGGRFRNAVVEFKVRNHEIFDVQMDG